MNNTTGQTPGIANTASGAAIQRYKIGYHADEWGQRSSTPSGIPDASGSWVRYADHVNALAAGQATAAAAATQPAPATQQAGIPGNFITHRAAWREALETAKFVSTGVDRSYWDHELAAFDRSFDRLWTLMQDALQPAAKEPVCKGVNCSAVRGVGHSTECEFEHDSAASTLNTAGNRNPEARYAGYKGQPALPAYTEDQLAAWQEGASARITTAAQQPATADIQPAPATQQAGATGECTGPRCMASSANGYAHSRGCIDEAAETQGWTPTADDYAKCGPSAPQPVAREPLVDEQFGEICDRLTKLVREKRAKHIQRGIDAGTEYYIGDAAHYVGHAVNQAAHGIKRGQHGTK